jgi:hypothetical protein
LLAADRRDRDGDRAEDQLDRRRRKELAAPVAPEARGEPAGCDPTRQEAGKREQGPPDRQTVGAPGCEPEEDDVPGHVGDEHVSEAQIGDRVDEAGHDRQDDQQWR